VWGREVNGSEPLDEMTKIPIFEHQNWGDYKFLKAGLARPWRK